jgi:ERCC4-related helicase
MIPMREIYEMTDEELAELAEDIQREQDERYRRGELVVLTPQAIEAACAVERRECANIAKKMAQGFVGTMQNQICKAIADEILARGAK